VHLTLRQRTGSICKNVPENDGFVMQLVASRKDERERIISRDRPKLAEEFTFMGEFSLVPPAELDPSVGVMPEPSAQLCAGSHVLDPPIDGGLGLA
jgi:hypothetical protein